MNLDLVLAWTRSAEAGLADSLDQLADRHADDHDVAHVARDLAQWSRDHVAAIDGLGRPVPGDASGRRVPPAADGDDPGLALLQDVRAVYQEACGVAADWEAIGQAARATRDLTLLGVVERCSGQVGRQVTWLRATIKESAPQVLSR